MHSEQSPRAPQPSTRSYRSSRQRRRSLIWSIVVGSVLATTSTVVIVDTLGTERSSTKTLTISKPSNTPTPANETMRPASKKGIARAQNPRPFASNRDHFSYWWQIPTDAKIQDFPDNPTRIKGNYTCSPEQYKWLQKNAKPAPSFGGWGLLELTLSNNATAGGSLSLKNIRFIGNEVDSVPLISFSCPTGGMGNSFGQLILMGIDGRAARWSKGATQSTHQEGMPATINVSPQKASHIFIARAPEVDTQRQYEGTVLADIARTEETVTLAEDVSFQRESVPGFFVGYGTYAQGDGRFRCGVPETSPSDPNRTKTHPCTLKEAALLMKRAAETVERP